VRAAAEESPSLESILRPVLFVSGRKHILELLRTMQQSLTHMAIVQDEFGVTQGLVTQEDILEELVGEIRDEFDREELLAIRVVPDGGWDALGRLKVADFNRETGAEIPGEPGDTLGGLVFHGLGRAARPGETVEVGGYTIRATEVTGRRIRRVHVDAVEEPEVEAPAD
jgi:putative hemolysin